MVCRRTTQWTICAPSIVGNTWFSFKSNRPKKTKINAILIVLVAFGLRWKTFKKRASIVACLSAAFCPINAIQSRIETNLFCCCSRSNVARSEQRQKGTNQRYLHGLGQCVARSKWHKWDKTRASSLCYKRNWKNPKQRQVTNSTNENEHENERHFMDAFCFDPFICLISCVKR